MALLQVAEAIGPLTDLDEIVSTIVRLTPLFVGVDVCAHVPGGQRTRSADWGSQAYGLSPEVMNEFATLRCCASRLD